MGQQRLDFISQFAIPLTRFRKECASFRGIEFERLVVYSLELWPMRWHAIELPFRASLHRCSSVVISGWPDIAMQIQTQNTIRACPL